MVAVFCCRTGAGSSAAVEVSVGSVCLIRDFLSKYSKKNVCEVNRTLHKVFLTSGSSKYEASHFPKVTSLLRNPEGSDADWIHVSLEVCVK